MTVTKDQLTESYRGGPKGKAHKGTIVRTTRALPIGKPIEDGGMGIIGWRPVGGVFEVCDLFARKTWNKPDAVGVKFLDKEIAFGAPLDALELVG